MASEYNKHLSFHGMGVSVAKKQVKEQNAGNFFKEARPSGNNTSVGSIHSRQIGVIWRHGQFDERQWNFIVD